MDAVGACPASFRRPVVPIWVVLSIVHADNTFGPVDCIGRVDIDSAVGDMLECNVVFRCIVAAGCKKVGDVEGCNWMTVLVFGHVYWTNKRRTTAVNASERNLTSACILNVLPVRADG